MAYQPLVYKTSGGDQLVVASGGVIEFQSGASLSLTGQTITTTGAITGNSVVATSGITALGGAIYGAAGYREYVQSLYTTVATAVVSFGLTYTGCSSGGAGAHFIVPALGVRKMIVCTWSTSTGTVVVITSGTWDGTNDEITFSTGLANTQWVDAIGISTALWRILGRSTDFTLG